MTYQVEIRVMPLKDLLDPQGKAVLGGLGNLGMSNITDVRIGKHIVLQAGPAVQGVLLNEWFLYGLIAGLCWLMVSNLPLMGLKFRDFGFRSNLPKWILAAVALASGLLLQWLAVPLVFAAYIALSLGFQSRRTS